VYDISLFIPEGICFAAIPTWPTWPSSGVYDILLFSPEGICFAAIPTWPTWPSSGVYDISLFSPGGICFAAIPTWPSSGVYDISLFIPEESASLLLLPFLACYIMQFLICVCFCCVSVNFHFHVCVFGFFAFPLRSECVTLTEKRTNIQNFFYFSQISSLFWSCSCLAGQLTVSPKASCVPCCMRLIYIHWLGYRRVPQRLLDRAA
jgi:hypothetical protein